jgi:hypothetical protein
VDPTGELYDGTKMDGPVALRQALLKRSDTVLASFTESLMTYALGRRVEFYDMPAIRTILRDAKRNDYRISAFILGVAKSAAFRMSRVEQTETSIAANRPPGAVGQGSTGGQREQAPRAVGAVSKR